MAKLQLVVQNLDDVDEKFRDLYEKKGDSFELSVGGLKTNDDVKRLQGALDKEKNDHKTAKEALRVATETLATFGDMKPEEVTAKLEKLAQLEAAGPNPKVEDITKIAERLAEDKVKAATQKLQRENDALKAERDTFKGESENLKGQIVGRSIEDVIRAAATSSKVLPEAVPDVIALARNDFKMVDGKPQTEDGRDASQWLEDKKKAAPFFWPTAKGAGAGGGDGGNLPAGGDNPFSHGGWNVTKQGELMKANPTQAAKLAEQAGVPKNPDGSIRLGVRPPAPAK